MLSLNGHHRYYIYAEPADTCLPARLASRQVRKGFDGLSGLVRQHFTADLMSGDVFVFMNRRRDRIKLLLWDQTGFAIFYKRLESGTFQLPRAGKSKSLELSWPELAMLLEGIELKMLKRRKRYRKTG